MDIPNIVSIYDISETGHTVTVVANAPLGVKAGDMVTIAGTGTAYDGTWPVVAAAAVNPYFAANLAFTYTNPTTGLADINESQTATAALAARIDGHVDPRPIMDVGVMNGNIPAPLMAIDEDDEFFLTLTNVGMIMRPDLFEQHTVHFHGYPNASSFYDGVPDASVAINIGAQLHLLLPGAGCRHLLLALPHHAARAPADGHGRADLRAAAAEPGAGGEPACIPARAAQQDTRSAHRSASRRRDILCSNPLPAVEHGDRRRPSSADRAGKYAYNDGDGSTYYDVEYPIQIHGFDPNFHFVGMTFNPEGFADMKDKYFLLNGRSYPDTAHRRPAADAVAATARMHFSQPLPPIINIPAGEQGAAAHLRPGRDRVPDAGFARHPDAGDRLQRQAAARPGRQQHCTTRPTRSRWAAASRWT